MLLWKPYPSFKSSSLCIPYRYLNRGLKLTAVYRTIDYEPREIFSWFVNEVANNRRKGDADKDKALLAEVFKLLGNSAYGKFIEAVEQYYGYNRYLIGVSSYQSREHFNDRPIVNKICNAFI